MQQDNVTTTTTIVVIIPNYSLAGRWLYLHYDLYDRYCIPVPGLNVPMLQKPPRKIKI